MASIAKIKRDLERHRDRIGKERDKLRDAISDWEELERACSEAYDDIHCAIDRLSELA